MGATTRALQNLMGVTTRALQNFFVLYSRDKDATIENFKMEILICLNSFIIEH